MPDTQEDVKTSVEESTSTDTTEETEEVSEEQIQNQTEETQETTEKEPSIDYKAELAKAEEKAERAKQIAQWERSKRKQLQKEQGSEEVEEKSYTDIDSKLAELRREQAQDMIDDELDAITSNEDEKKLIQKIYESRISPTGYTRRAIKEDIALAKIIANRPLYERQLVAKAKAEAKKELEEEQAMSGASSGTSSGRRSPTAPAKVLNESENKWKTFIEKAKARAERRR